MKNFSVIVPAAGKGLRMGHELPKQYLKLNGIPILERTLAVLLGLEPKNLCLVVDEQDDHWQSIDQTKRCQIAKGGASRADSVLSGLVALGLEDDEMVLVHDAVRPFVDVKDIRKLLAEVGDSGGLLGIPVVDTLKQVDAEGQVTMTPDRSQFWHAQTPQAFPAGVLKEAMQRALDNHEIVNDEASAVERIGIRPKVVLGNKRNIKITTQEDLAFAEFLLRGLEQPA